MGVQDAAIASVVAQAAAFVWEMPVAQVYFILSLEEAVRLILSLIIFRSRNWMRRL